MELSQKYLDLGYNLAKENNFNHKCEIEEGVLEEECSVILSEFFKELRCKCGSSNQIKYKDK